MPVGWSEATKFNNLLEAVCTDSGIDFTKNAMCSMDGATCTSNAGMSVEPVKVEFDTVTFEFFGKPFSNHS